MKLEATKKLLFSEYVLFPLLALFAVAIVFVALSYFSLLWVIMALIALVAFIFVLQLPEYTVALLFLIIIPFQQYLWQRWFPIKYADEVSTIVLLLVLFLRKSARGEPFWGGPLDLPLAAFLGLSLISALLNEVPPLVMALGLYATLKSVLMFYICSNLNLSLPRVKRFIILLLYVSTAIAVIALLQFILGERFTNALGLSSPIRAGIPRMVSVFNHPAHLGHFMTFVLPIGLGLHIEKGWEKRDRLTIIITLMALALILAVSRVSWVAFILSLFFISLRIRSKRAIFLSLIIILIVVVGVSTALATSEPLREELGGRLTSVREGLLNLGGGYLHPGMFWGELRLYFWAKTLEVLSDYPWLGVGPGRYGGWISMLFRSPIYEQYSFHWFGMDLSQLESDWIRTLGEGGLFGFLAFGGVLYFLFRMFSSVYGKTSQPFLKSLALGGMFAWVVLVIEGFASPAFEDPLISLYFWGLGGAVVALWREEKEKK